MWGDSYHDAMHHFSDVVFVLNRAVEKCERDRWGAPTSMIGLATPTCGPRLVEGDGVPVLDRIHQC